MGMFWRGLHKFKNMEIISGSKVTAGENSFRIDPGYTIQQAMDDIVDKTDHPEQYIILAPGTYQEDVVWTDVPNVVLVAEIPNTVVIEAVTAFAVSIDPAAAGHTWGATLQGMTVSHGDGLVGIQVNNTNVGKRINLYLNDIDIESETPTDHAIDVNRSGAAGNAIRLYANGHGNTIEGLVDFISENTDDRVRFWGYRLIGGITVTGAIVNEITFVNCGIKVSGESFDGANVSSHFGCYYENDAQTNDHTLCADDADTT